MWRAWGRAGLTLVLACACGSRALDRAADAGGVRSTAAPDGSTAVDASAGSRGGPPPGDASAGGGEGGRSGSGIPEVVSVCPAGAVPVPVEAAPVTPLTPTRVPFSCAPMPEAFVFPPPAPETEGLYSRCASLAVGRARALTVSPDGKRVALVTGDGILRLVEVASRQVVAVIARPRAMIDAATFAPNGLGILTVARGQNEVTFWRALDWAPVWTVRLPGHLYEVPYQNFLYSTAAAFAPDGRTVAVSPGIGLYLLDVATGAVRAPALDGASILDVAYGLDGARIVAAVAAIGGHCVQAPNGGTVELLDGVDLRGIARLANLGSYPGHHGIPEFLVSPAADLVLVSPALDQPPGIRAFRLSDGGELARPGLDTLPLAFTRDGKRMLLRAGGKISLVETASSAVIGSTPDVYAAIPAGIRPGPIAMSPDGGRVALGGSGKALLATWNPADGAAPVPVCAAEDAYDGPALSSLSRDGQLVALGLGHEARVVRRADGATLARIARDPSTEATRVDLSPSGRYVVATPTWISTGPSNVFRVTDGARVGGFATETKGWVDFLFTPDERRLFSTGARPDAFELDVLDLASGGPPSTATVPDYTMLVGYSAGCPVLYAQPLGAWRSCGACNDTAIAAGEAGWDVFGPSNAVLSSDGRTLATAGKYGGPGVTLWRMPPGAAELRTIGPRASEAVFDASEFPVAVAPGGGRILTGAHHAGSCYNGPDFEVHVRNTATGALLDALPPGVTAVDAAVRTLAYGAQLWCAR